MRLKYPCLKLADWKFCPVVRGMPRAEVIPSETPGSAVPLVFTRGDRERFSAIWRIEQVSAAAHRRKIFQIGETIMNDIRLQLNPASRRADFASGIKLYFPTLNNPQFDRTNRGLFFLKLSLQSDPVR